MQEKDKIHEIRAKKLKRILEQGLEAYPASAKRTHTNKEAIDNFKRLKNKDIFLVGRLTRMRLMGKACFANLKDFSAEIQIYFKYDVIGRKKFEFLKEQLDLGDFLEVEGQLFKTHTGEITLAVKEYRLLAKALRALPEKWHGLRNVELRHRQRYLDLLSNPEVKERFVLRSKIIANLRGILDKEGFLEVETPILQNLPGGAAAKPFKTYHEALNQYFYLRIAPELYLKKLLVGGFEKIYEIGKVFRNEGMDRYHNPEFTMFELYFAYQDYQQLMSFVENLLIKLIKTTTGRNFLEYQKKKIQLKAPFKRITYRTIIKKFTGIDIFENRSCSSLLRAIKKLKIKHWDIPGTPTWPKIVDELFKEQVRPYLIQPTFIINHPVELSPLAKKRKENPYEVERFQLYIGGLEVCNAFSELNDPCDQRERFLEQQALRKTGDEEAMLKDEDFIEALEYGMPPTAGLGIGIDRLVMLLTNQPSIREVILFPQLRSKNQSKLYEADSN